MEKKEIATYEQAVEYILDIPKFTQKNDVKATKSFLKELGNPEKGMKIIHIAGTNGKGSVCAYLRSILEEGGFSAGMFTSPHLVDIRERFLISGEMVTKEQFYEAFLQVYSRIKGEYHPTFFEYLFFMAMLIFKEKRVDYCILETGLGGRLDATNAVEEKEVCIITKIGFDHMEYLGNTLSEIAGEKAGIITQKTPVVYYAGKEEVNKIIEKKAEEENCQIFPVFAECDAICKNTNKNIDFSFHSRYYGYIKLILSTHALYQTENAALAVTAIEAMGLSGTITKAQLKEGLQRSVWEGRMEEVKPGIILDGAHNEDGMEAFLDTAGKDACEGKRMLLFSALHDKRYEVMVSKIQDSGLFSVIGIAPVDNVRAATENELETIFKQYKNSNIICYSSAEEAFEQMQMLKGEKDRLYAAGSLYLVGQLKAYLRRQTDD